MAARPAGRRRPYFALGAVPFVLSFALLWADFGLTSQVGMFVTYTAIYILYSVCSTVLTVPIGLTTTGASLTDATVTPMDFSSQAPARSVARTVTVALPC